MHILRPLVMVILGEQSFFYTEFADRNFQRLEVTDLIHHRSGFMVVVI